MNGECLLLFQNLDNDAYVKAVFGNGDIATVFRMEMELIPKTSTMTPNRGKQLLETAREMLMSGGLPNIPYQMRCGPKHRRLDSTLAPSGLSLFSVCLQSVFSTVVGNAAVEIHCISYNAT